MNQLCVVIAFKNSCKDRFRNLSFLKDCLLGVSLDVIICEETEDSYISEFRQENIRTIQVPSKKDFNKLIDMIIGNKKLIKVAESIQKLMAA